MGNDESDPEAKFTGNDPCENHHWSHAVHSHVGNKLYLILIKFVSTGVRFKDSIVKNITDAGISDYSTFELYASHDLLIRAWADQDSYFSLLENIESNNDVDSRHTDPMEADSVHHFPDDGPGLGEAELRTLAASLDAASIEIIQNGADAEAEKRLVEKGIRIPDSVRFDKDRIQFYIIISAFKHDRSHVQKFERRVGTFDNIRNKTIYYTKGHASEAVIKGQVQRDSYYEINRFVNAVADAVNHHDIRTETALVADVGPCGNGRIDTDAAQMYLIEREFKELVGSSRNLDRRTAKILLGEFVEAEIPRAHDRKGVLREMIRLRAHGQTGNFDHIRTYFTEFEDCLLQRLGAVISGIYGKDYEDGRKGLFSREGLNNGGKRHLVLGDLTKIYRRIVDENQIINIDPLDSKEFDELMKEVVELRNKLMHTVPELPFWETAFQFFKKFVIIEYRFNKYFESIRRSNAPALENGQADES